MAGSKGQDDESDEDDWRSLYARLGTTTKGKDGPSNQRPWSSVTSTKKTRFSTPFVSATASAAPQPQAKQHEEPNLQKKNPQRKLKMEQPKKYTGHHGEDKSDRQISVILSDTDVLDCPICFEPLRPPVFQTHVLKVHVHCHGCVQKVKKLLRRIEGVYEVTIDSEEHKVTVSGNVDCATLIRKLAKSGKQAKLWSSSPSQDHELTNWPYDDKYLNQMQNPKEYLNQGLGMEFLKCEKENSLGMEAKMDDEILGWDGSIVNDAGTAEGGMKSLTSLRGHNPGFVGLEGREISKLQNFCTRMPGPEYCYPSPILMNNMQGHWYCQPYPILIFHHHAGDVFHE